MKTTTSLYAYINASFHRSEKKYAKMMSNWIRSFLMVGFTLLWMKSAPIKT